MNIFYLSMDASICAKMHCDAHVNKMCVEYAQILSTAKRFFDHVKITKYYYKNPKDPSKNRWKPIWLLPEEHIDKSGDIINKQCYIQTHINHPACKWVRSSFCNYDYLYNLWISLLNEFEYRYKKSHLSANYISIFEQYPNNMNVINKRIEIPRMFGEWDQHVPIYYNRVDEFRTFYKKSKSDFLNYTNREIPYWLKECNIGIHILNNGE